MTKPPDHLRLIEGVRGHLHAAHGLHLPVHREELVLGDADVERGGVAEVGWRGAWCECLAWV